MTQLIIPLNSQTNWNSPIYNNPESFYDVVFTSEDDSIKIYAHKCILQFNDYFKTFFTTSMRSGKDVDKESNAEVIIVDDLPIIDIILRHIYEGNEINLKNISVTNFYSLTCLASEWLMNNLKKQLFLHIFHNINTFLENDISNLQWIDNHFGDMAEIIFTEYREEYFYGRARINPENKKINGYQLIRECENYIDKNLFKVPIDILNWNIFKKLSQKIQCRIYIAHNLFEKLADIKDSSVVKELHTLIFNSYNRNSKYLTLKQFYAFKNCDGIITSKNQIINQTRAVGIVSYKPLEIIKYTYIGQITFNKWGLDINAINNFNTNDTIFFNDKKYIIDSIQWYDQDVDEAVIGEIFNITLKDCKEIQKIYPATRAYKVEKIDDSTA